VKVHFAQTSTTCIERVVGKGAAQERLGERGNPYLAGLGLQVEGAPVGNGVSFHPGIERGRLPHAFVVATEEGVRSALRQGRHGWEVTDCVVTMTSSQYFPRQSRPHQTFDKSISSIAADFRKLAPVVVTAALRRAGTRVCEPVERFELDLPDDAHRALAAVLGRLGAVVLDVSTAGGFARLLGDLPSARVAELAAVLPDLTAGEGALVTRFDRHVPVTGGPSPSRRRRGPDPHDREVWFRDVPR
jgi:ribosomal protection tetracycline resistance protein